MKKILTCAALVVLTMALALYVGATFFLGSVAKAGVNRIGPKLTQTRVVLDGATISPLTGRGTLTGLEVDNPAGWTTGQAFYLGQVQVSLKPFSIFGDHIVINEIEITQPEFFYETRIFSSNINDLLKNIEQTMGNDRQTAVVQTTGGKAIRFEVRRFRLVQGKVTVGVGTKTLVLQMPPIELKDLGTKEGGITASELAAAVMRSVTGGVVSATTQAAGQLGTTSGAAVIEKAKQAGEDIKKLFNGGK